MPHPLYSVVFPGQDFLRILSEFQSCIGIPGWNWNQDVNMSVFSPKPHGFDLFVVLWFGWGFFEGEVGKQFLIQYFSGFYKKKDRVT